MPPEAQVRLHEQPSINCVMVDPFRISDHGKDAADMALSDWLQLRSAMIAMERRIDEPMPVLYGKLYLPARHYPSVAAIWEDIVSQCNHIFGPRYNVQFRTILYADGMHQLALCNGGTVTIYTDSRYIAQVLGLSVEEEELPGRGLNTIILYKAEPRAVRAPILGSVQALYVYTDLIEYQHVGDKRAPLLAYVDVQKLPGERVTTLCNPPVYLPVCKSVINSITIQLCDERGEDVKFPADGDNVLVVLHFRPVCAQPHI